MRQSFRAVIVSVGLLVAVDGADAAPRDEICHQLRSFEIAPFAIGADGKPSRRSATFIWSGRWLSEDMSWGCRRLKQDAPSVALCAYLMNHASLEFRAALPLRVLRCYGYRFPQGAPLAWDKWNAEITLKQSSDRSLRLHVDLNPEEPSGAAVGISAVPDNESADAGSEDKPRAN
jgi:hypothetical protein